MQESRILEFVIYFKKHYTIFALTKRVILLRMAYPLLPFLWVEEHVHIRSNFFNIVKHAKF